MPVINKLLKSVPESRALSFWVNKRRAVQIKSLQQFLYVLTNIPHERINNIMKLNFTKSECSGTCWLTKNFPEIILLIPDFGNIEHMSPTELRQFLINNIRRILRYTKRN